MYVEHLITLILSPSSNHPDPITIIHTRLTNGKSNPVTERYPSWMYVEKVAEFHETSLLVLLTRLTNGKSNPVPERFPSWMYVERKTEFHETSIVLLLPRI